MLPIRHGTRSTRRVGDAGEGVEVALVGVGEGVEVSLGGLDLGVAHSVHDGLEVGAAGEEPEGYVLTDAARTVARLRDEGKRVLPHCVAAHSRTLTVGIAYAMLRGVPLDEALLAVCGVLPAAHPNHGFRPVLDRPSRPR